MVSGLPSQPWVLPATHIVFRHVLKERTAPVVKAWGLLVVRFYCLVSDDFVVPGLHFVPSKECLFMML